MPATLDRPETISKDDLESKTCQESFFAFVQRFWDVVIPEQPVWNWHIKYICDELQRIAERVFAGLPKEHDLIINVPPGSTKSTICSVMFPPWAWTRMPSSRSICGSHTAPLALDLARRSRMIVGSEKYTRLFSQIRLSDDQTAKGYYVNTRGGSRLSTMVGGKPTGFHAHFLLVDDPLDPKGALSEADLKSANDWMRETLPTRKVDKAIVPTILIMQRLHENDPTGEWLKRSQGHRVKHVCLPAEVSERVQPAGLKRMYRKGLLDPIRLGTTELEENRKQLGEFGYAGQFDQYPVPRGGGDFKVQRFVFERSIPSSMVHQIRYWDKAGTRGGGAYTVGTLMGKDKAGFYWVLDVKRGQWDAYERENLILATAKMDGIKTHVYIEQEPGSGGLESAQNTIRRLSGFIVRADRPVGDKETRAEPWAIQVNAGNVRVIVAPWNHEFVNEHMYWPNSKYKDQVDSAGGAFIKLQTRRRAGAL